MNQIITFRNYQESDYEVLREMIFALAKEDIDSEDTAIPMSDTKIQSTIKRSITHPGQLDIRIFEVDNSIVGYSLLTFYWSNEYQGEVAIIDELYVKPEYRNQGISTQFINLLVCTKQYAILQLEVFKKNLNALRFYQRMNFAIVDRYFMNKVL
jgi:GNAT superfamily N-acetyltransferase